ncbi:hypothetical protein GJ496_009969 [Pomphorhynchus laevis]|nr:hypothetical protein GJ496_009969 [Pomphorhynchus laevis]
MMSGSRSLEKKEEILKAVIIADIFDKKYKLMTSYDSYALWPIGTVPLFALSLSSLYHCSSIKHAIIISRSDSACMKLIFRKLLIASDMTVEFLEFPSANCVADVLRELYSKRILNSDFILFDALFVSTVDYTKIWNQFKLNKRRDCTAIGVVCYSNHITNPLFNSCENEVSLVVDNYKKIILFRKHHSDLSFYSGLLAANYDHYPDLTECHVSIFTEHLLSTVADNFDFQNISNVVKGIIAEEEITSHSLYSLILNDNHTHTAVTNLESYSRANFDFLSCRLYPLKIEMFKNLTTKLSFDGLSQLTHSESQSAVFRDCQSLKGSLVSSEGCRLGRKCYLSNAIIGSFSTIGDDVVLRDCIIWENTSIGNNCYISHSVVCNNVSIGHNVTIPDMCLIASGTVIPANTILQCKSIITKTEDVAVNIYKCVDISSREVDSDGASFNLWGEPVSSTEDDDSSSDDDNLYRADKLDECLNTVLEEDFDFLDREAIAMEIFQTIQRGIRERLDSDKLVLEINGIKHAYNVQTRHLIEHIIEGVFRLPIDNAKKYADSLENLFPKLEEFVKCYAKDEDTQVHLIYALETTALKYKEVASSSLLIHTMLYDRDVLGEPAIIRYYRNPLLRPQNEQAEKIYALRLQVAPFLHWLQTAEVESD